MKRLLSTLLTVLLCLSLFTACIGGEGPGSSAPEMAQPAQDKYQLGQTVTVYYEQIPSREITIPITLTLPAGQPGEQVPLVLFCHDFLGDRSTGGAFENLAKALADRGIASMAVDFSGCGESQEDFSASCLFYMELDIKAARNYAIENAPIDTGKVGLFGHGLGGRLALEMGSLKDSPYTAISLAAPLTDEPEATLRGLLGEEYDRMLAEAFSEQRYAEYTAPDGLLRYVSVNWFDDIRLSQPLKNLQHLKGALQVVYTPNDDWVPAEVVQQLIQAAQSQGAATVLQLEVAAPDHSLDFYEENSAIRQEVIEKVADFFAAAFK